MAAPIFPASVTVQGNIKLQWVPALTVAGPEVADEINATGSLDVSCFVAGDAWNPDYEQNKGEAPRRLCTKVSADRFGNLKYTLPDLMYSTDPQAASGSDGKKAYATLQPGLKGFLVARYGLDAIEEDWAAAQIVDVWPVELGPRLKVADPSNEFNEFMVKQSIILASPYKPYEDVALVA